jgi:hypothetical protein
MATRRLGVLQTEKPLSASALGDDKAARKKFREMRTRGLGRYGGRHRQLRRGMTIAV